MTKHRSDRERARIVRAWRRSRRSARAFAAEQGISDTTLFNWARGLGGAAADAALARTDVELVEVVPVGAPPAEAEGWSWEIETRGGVVRGRGALDAGAVVAIVGALGGSRR
jgi:hypothetical protein